MGLNSNYQTFQMAFKEMPARIFAEQIGYSFSDFRTQVVRRWEIIEKLSEEDLIQEDIARKIIEHVLQIKRADSADRRSKAHRMHLLFWGQPDSDTTLSLPTESNEKSVMPEERRKNQSQLKEVEKTLKRTDFGFIQAFIEWLSAAAPLGVIVFAAASFIGTGIFNAVFYGKQLGMGMGVVLAFIQDGSRFALFLASAKMFKESKTALGFVSAIGSLGLVGFEIYESPSVARAWNTSMESDIAVTFGFIVLLGFLLELVMALMVHNPFKQN